MDSRNTDIRKQRSGLAILVIVLAILGITADCQKDAPAVHREAPPPSKDTETITISAPDYVVLDKEITDDQIKTQVVIHAAASGSLSRENLEKLLRVLHEDACATSGLKHHGGEPTHVFVYVYTSEEHYKSGMGQWIAMLSRIGKNANPKIDVKDNLLAQQSLKPETKYGLSEEQRKDIFRRSVLIEDRAFADAEKRYPSDLTKQMELANELMDRYEQEFAKECGLTVEQLTEIAVEGLEKNWPMP
jgi:hypothetical protein